MGPRLRGDDTIELVEEQHYPIGAAAATRVGAGFS
jgi:hypothetical protein